jgi:hypothetical protein
MKRKTTLSVATVLLTAVVTAIAQQPARFEPGQRVLLDAHNAYPYQGRWSDRLDRALATGTPLAVEQDLIWYPSTPLRASPSTPLKAEPSTSRSIVSHGEPYTGSEPSLRDFFEHIRPLITRALDTGSRDNWPIITLNLDFKDSDPQHFAAIWNLLGEYEQWLTTARRVADLSAVQPLDVGPVLVLTGADTAQQAVFHDAVPVGSRLRLFGAAPAANIGATNYLRWVNYPWSAVESEGQTKAGMWTDDDKQRLHALVERAHAAGLWIRFYTLNGHSAEDGERMGYTPSYNFTSIDQARVRWRAAIVAGVDFVATDQYEEFRKVQGSSK